MTSLRALAFVAAAVAMQATAALQMPGRAYDAPAPAGYAMRLQDAETVFRWDAPAAKVTDAFDDPRRTRVGVVRPAPKAVGELGWRPVDGGWISRFDVESQGALGLRIRLDLSGAGRLHVLARGADGRVESMHVAAGASVAWGPWTGGALQSVEVFGLERPPAQAVRLGAVAHFDQPLDAKAAGTCTIDTACTSGDSALDAAIAERTKSIARITFVDGGATYVCTGTLLNSEKFPTPFFLTANHCIGSADAAASITSFWFFDNTACGAGPVNPNARQVPGGMTIVLADFATDQTLLQMNTAPPAGVTFSGWDATLLSVGDPVVSLSHPTGDVAKYAIASVVAEARIPDWPQSVWLTTFTRGIVQAGSSGSGLFTRSAEGLKLRAVLSASTINSSGSGLSCTNPGEYGIYNRFDVFYPEVARYLQANPAPVADDHGNRPQEATPVSVGAAETTVTGRIDYPGDIDVFRIAVATPGTLIAQASGGLDTVGVFMNANGEGLVSNDDARATSTDFGITYRVNPGTYYLAVSHWESSGTGSYAVKLSMAPVTDNYTDLWWNPSESGWGINLNHQGQTLFATLFTYDTDGSPLWLVMSNGARQADGSFEGALYRVTGPVFNANPWTAVTPVQVGTLRIAFPGSDSGLLHYTFNGVAVDKAIQRQKFSAATQCSWSAFDRAYAFNFQDLWWNPAESGWGINLAHQGDILFATLFTYASGGRGIWFVMSNGARKQGTAEFSGTLYRTTGPAFNASPWAAVTPIPVGTMTVSFSQGNQGMLQYTVDGVSVVKSIQRQVFGFPTTECERAD
jgi:hypothetical protein